MRIAAYKLAPDSCGVESGFSIAKGLRFLLWAWFGAQMALTAQVAGPLAVSGNPNYFKNPNGTVLILNGSQTWNTLQDWGSNGSLQLWTSKPSSIFSLPMDTISHCFGLRKCRNSAAFQAQRALRQI